jgi:hypothetical protein
LVVGFTNYDGSVLVIGYLTSNKGNHDGIAGFSYTHKLSNVQAISGQNKGQYFCHLQPPLQVNDEHFTEHSVATEYINQTEIIAILRNLKNLSMNPIKYNTLGITKDELEQMAEVYTLITTKTSEVQKNAAPNETDD